MGDSGRQPRSRLRDDLGLNQGESLFGSAWRKIREKGHSCLVSALAKISARREDLHLASGDATAERNGAEVVLGA